MYIEQYILNNKCHKPHQEALARGDIYPISLCGKYNGHTHKQHGTIPVDLSENWQAEVGNL